MSIHIGATLECDHRECDDRWKAPTEEEARKYAEKHLGWSRTEDGRDFCRYHTEVRASRKKVEDLVPPGVRLFTAFEAADEVCFQKAYHDDEAGTAHFFCCGQEVEVSSLIGSPYGARCKKCGTAIADVFGPMFGNGSVAFPDPDKVDVETDRTWVIVSEYNKAKEQLSQGEEVG